MCILYFTVDTDMVSMKLSLGLLQNINEGIKILFCVFMFVCFVLLLFLCFPLFLFDLSLGTSSFFVVVVCFFFTKDFVTYSMCVCVRACVCVWVCFLEIDREVGAGHPTPSTGCPVAD